LAVGQIRTWNASLVHLKLDESVHEAKSKAEPGWQVRQMGPSSQFWQLGILEQGRHDLLTEVE
jgi:hypothetical protein